MLLEIAQLYVFLVKQEKILSQGKLTTNRDDFFSKRYNEMFSFLLLLKRDPVAAYSELKKRIFESRILLEKVSSGYRVDQINYGSLLEKILKMLEQTKLIKNAQHYLENYQKGRKKCLKFILVMKILK